MCCKLADGWLKMCVVSLCLLSIAGCSGETGPKREYGEVTGKVTYKGEALKMGDVMFQPASGAPAAGQIKADGTYSLKAVLGSNTVMITSRDAAPAAPAAGPLTSQPVPKSHIPEAYGSPQSTLKFEVKKGKNEANFDLK